MATDPFLGKWRIAGVMPHYNTSTHPDIAGVEDVEFSLLDTGDVVWENVKDPDIPLFNCSSYQVLRERNCMSVVVLLRFCSWRGNVLEFRVEQDRSTVPRSMYLTLDGWCMLYCRFTRSLDEHQDDFKFNFEAVNEQSLFTNSSLQVQSSDVAFHSLFLPDEIRSKLEEADLDVVHTVLHYLHAECLPASISSALVDKVEKFLSEKEILKDLQELCGGFSKSVKIQEEFSTIVYEIHEAIDQVLLMMGGKIVDDLGRVRTPRNKTTSRLVISNPPRIGAILKQTLKNAIFVVLKIVQFCARYEEIKNDLTRTERNKIIMFAKSRIVIFVNQLLELLKSLKYATADLNPQTRQELAVYFVPEVEEFGYFVTNLGLAINDVLEMIVQKTIQRREARLNKDANGRPVKSMKFALLTKEILILKTLNDKLGVLFAHLVQEREGFVVQQDHEKIRDLARQIEQIVDEIPLLILHLEKFAHHIHEDKKMDDKTFLFDFTCISSQVAAVLVNLQQFKDLMEPMIQLLRSTLMQENIESCLEALGLIKSKENRKKFELPNFHERLDLTGRFSTSPFSRQSRLAKVGLELYESKENTDMEFELLQDTSPPLAYTQTDGDSSPKIDKISAHRVIVCARCPWFLRALTSGMREERERKITLHDCDPDIFKIFLKFIYCGLYDLDLAGLPTQTLADLLLLADRYEMEDLLNCCEESLCRKLEDDTVFPLLVLGDQFNTPRLRHACFVYIASNPRISVPENTSELPSHLWKEVARLTNWTRLDSTGGSGQYSSGEKPKKDDLSDQPDGDARKLDLGPRGASFLNSPAFAHDHFEELDLLIDDADDPFTGSQETFDKDPFLDFGHARDVMDPARCHAVDEASSSLLGHDPFMTPAPQADSRRANDTGLETISLEEMTRNLFLTDDQMPNDHVPETTDNSRLEACVQELRDALGPLVPEEQLVQAALLADSDTNQALKTFLDIPQKE